MTTLVRYRSEEEDSGRWLAFPFRHGDIVISTRSKSGTTWMQTICALLIFQTADLPAPLAHLSPWLDWLITPQQQVYDQLAAQQHRRFIKTHTPLDGVPIAPHVSYVVVARHPLDMAVSLYHQGENIDRKRLRQLTGGPPSDDAPPAPPPLRPWLVRWTESHRDPREAMDSLPGVLWHLTDAWRRRQEPNVLLVHYDDLLTDLEGQMRHIAAWLGIEVPAERWATLVEAATFGAMRERAQILVPDAVGVLKDRHAFFRQDRSGAGAALLSTEELRRYHRRAAELAPPDLLAWLHRRS
ncbi:sulfotransferase domain-containing protein [Micromonospora sp. NPDC050187]|uniref:sulfotransferase domain-containing protein n=1 Tax=Micromonospora sp. NPDC050187 TaxID=3364277 RepID=UPI0037A2CCD8